MRAPSRADIFAAASTLKRSLIRPSRPSSWASTGGPDFGDDLPNLLIAEGWPKDLHSCIACDRRKLGNVGYNQPKSLNVREEALEATWRERHRKADGLGPVGAPCMRDVLRQNKDIPQVGPLQWGRIMRVGRCGRAAGLVAAHEPAILIASFRLTSRIAKRRPAPAGGRRGAGRRVPGFGEETPGIRNVGVSPETEFAKIVAIVPIFPRFADLRDEVIE